MNIDINGVSITLTNEQLQQINKQLNNKLKIEDINSIEDAELVLKDCINHEKLTRKDFPNNSKYWNVYCLETIIKAVNYIDNDYQEWIPNFNNSNITKYIPYFRKENSSWLLHCVFSYGFCSYCSVGLYYKKESTAKLIANKNLNLYKQYLG